MKAGKLWEYPREAVRSRKEVGFPGAVRRGDLYIQVRYMMRDLYIQVRYMMRDLHIQVRYMMHGN
jgi:hypothetical protein